LLRLARGQLDTGGPGDPALLSRAARRARQMFDIDLAARLARAAFDSGGGVEAGLVLGEAEFVSGHHEAAELVLAGPVSLCADDGELALVANARAYNLGVPMGDPAAAAAVVDEALSIVTDVTTRLRLLGRLATTKAFESEPEATLAGAEELLGSSDNTMIPRGGLRVLYRFGAARPHRAGGSGGTSRLGQPPACHRRTVARNTAHRRTTRPHRRWRSRPGRDLCDHWLPGVPRGRRQRGMATFSLMRGWVRVDQGHLAGASRAFLEGASINRELRETGALRWCVAGLALAEGMAGHAAAAVPAMTELDGIELNWMTIFDADLIDRGRAWTSVATGEVSRASATLREAAEGAAVKHQWAAEAHLLHDVARLGEPASVAPRLAELARIIDGRLSGVFAAHAAALVQTSASDLETASVSFESFGARCWRPRLDLPRPASTGPRALLGGPALVRHERAS
jgi:hypothetical protein